MLASTVQFSSNDQPPNTPTRKQARFTGAGVLKTDHTAVPSGPNNVPDTTPPHPDSFHAPEGAVLEAQKDQGVPNSQRSTHERTSTGHAPVVWPSDRR